MWRTSWRVWRSCSPYTLRFVKSGRVSAAAAFAGELLSLRPIIHMVDDTTSTIAKVRGDSAVMPGLIVQTKNGCEGAPYLIGATDDGNAKMLAKMCKKEFGYAPAATFLLGAAVATNTGPNAVAIVYQG
ncbi:MAG: DegV family protein [Ruthenibacterium lactatiformans]